MLIKFYLALVILFIHIFLVQSVSAEEVTEEQMDQEIFTDKL